MALTEEQAEAEDWPCWMCEHDLGSHTPEKKICLHCRRKGRKPINFKLQMILLSTQPRGGQHVNRM